MASPDSRKILRIGVIQNGAIIEERLLRRREAVTVGTQLKSTFCLTAPDFPASFTLFEVRGGRYHLNFDDSMRGRVSVGQGVHKLSHLKKSGRAEARGKHWSVVLDERSRGKLVIGEVVFLFQFVTAPPARSAPQLPVTLRGGPLTFLNNTVELTGTYGIALLFSLVIQVGFVIYLVLEVPPPPRPVGVADLPDEIMMILTEMQEPPSAEMANLIPELGAEVVAESAVEAEIPQDAVEEVQEERRSDGRSRDTEEPQRSREEQLRLARDAVRRLSPWSSVTSPSAGGVGDAMEQIFNTTDQRVGEVLARQQARGGGSLASRTGSLSGVGDGDGDGGGDTVNVDIGRSRTTERAFAVESGQERQRIRVQANIRQSRTQTAGSGRLDADSLNAVLSRRVRDVQRCYERVLAEDPSLGGRVVLQFTIDTSGRVTDVHLVENEVGRRVGDCIEGRVRLWRFDPPEGGNVTVRKIYILAPAD